MRAERWASGEPLPSPGTFQEEVVLALDRRQKNREFAQLYVHAKLMEVSFGLRPEFVDDLLSMFEMELYQTIYMPSKLREIRASYHRRRQAEIEKAKEKARQEAVVASWTQDD